MKILTPAEIINWLKLQPNALEGGYFNSTYESPLRLDDAALPGFPAVPAGRPLCSAIYYFLEAGGCSVLHRVTGDMIYHFYAGDPVQMLLLYPDGHPNHSEIFLLSSDLAAGGSPSKVIPGGTWLGSRLLPGGSCALMGVTMAPGFDPQDYAIGRRSELSEKYPEQAPLIELLTREEAPAA